MLRLLLILLFFFTISLHCMESEPKKSSKEIIKRKSTSLFVSRKLSNEKNEKIIPEHPLIFAARSQNYTLLTFYLKNPYFNPNIQDEHKNTALHYAASTQGYAALEALLKDHRIDASIRNIDNKTARELINDNQDIGIEMRRKIFARVTLDMTTQKECLLIKSSYGQDFMKPDILSVAIHNIKKVIYTIEQKQSNLSDDSNDEYGNLPSSACFPDYATDKFIENKIWFLLSSKDS
jgi:ankyrin repeat protein